MNALPHAPREASFLRFAPPAVGAHPALCAISEWAKDPGTQALLHDGQQAGIYPSEALAQLRRRGLSALLGPETTAWHTSTLNAILAQCDGSLAISVGVNMLALLPIHLDAHPGLARRVFERVAAGRSAAMLLTEWTHGSDLVGNELAAEQDEAGLRLRGEKQLINGGREHTLLTVLARTRPRAHGQPGSPGDHTLIWLERDPTVRPTPAWTTLCTRGADISGVSFEGTFVPLDQVIGQVGHGLDVVKRTLTLSRGGVSALSAGAAGKAVALVQEYAGARELYGQPIQALDAIVEQLERARTLEAVCAAVSLRAVAWANAFGIAAGQATAAAKLCSAQLAEEVVDEGRRVLSSRALLEAFPYAPLIRDVLLYGVFDGTSHLMLDELAFRLGRPTSGGEDWLALARQAWSTPPRPLRELRRPERRVLGCDPEGQARALAAEGSWPWRELLVEITREFSSIVAGLRTHGGWRRQRHRFRAGQVAGWLEAIWAAVELGDPALRARLEVPGGPSTTDEERALEAGALELVVRTARTLRELRAGLGGSDGRALEALEACALADHSRARGELEPAPRRDR